MANDGDLSYLSKKNI